MSERIRFEEVWKAYPRWGARTLREGIDRRVPGLLGGGEQRWVLRDVSFSVSRGEFIGVIGLNGAGKSTLLRLAAGLASPTRGRVLLPEETAAILNLGDLFDLALSGRENALTTALAAGLSARRGRALMPEIIAFAELEGFEDAPLRTYSDGMRLAGAEKYDQLAAHEIPWTDQSVKDALAEMAKIVGDTENVAGGQAGALQTDFPTSVSNVFSATPKAAMVLEGDFVPGVAGEGNPLEPETGFNVFPFPEIGDSGAAVVGGGDLVVLFNENPAAQAFIEYLTTPEASEIWAKRGGFSSPNKKVDASVYPDPIQQTTAGAIGEADTFRFDLSDLQPSAFGGTVGQGLFKLFQDFLKTPTDVDGITTQMEAAAAKAFG